MSDTHPGFGNETAEGAAAIPAPLRDPIGVLKRRWRSGLIAFVVLGLIGGGASTLIPVRYEAAARMLLSSKAIPDEYVPDVIVATSSEQFQAIENEVMSRASLAKLAGSDLFAEARERESVAEIADWLARSILIEKKAASDGRGFVRSIDIRISLVGEKPDQIAEVVNRIVDDLLVEYLAYRSEQSQVTLDFMRREYERADEALRNHQRDLAIFRDQNRGSLPEEQAATIAKLERLESQRRSTVLELNSARSQLSGLRKGAGTVSSSEPSPRERLEAELERLRALYTNEHPEVRALERRLAALDTEQVNTGQTQANSSARSRIQSEIAAREARLAEINQEVGFLEEQVSKTSGITEEYRALERKEGALQDAYDEYLRKLKNAELSRSMETAQQGAQLMRLEVANPPSSPMVPAFVYTIGALVAALMLSVALVLLLEFLDPVVIDEDHLEKISSFPTLGSIPPIA